MIKKSSIVNNSGGRKYLKTKKDLVLSFFFKKFQVFVFKCVSYKLQSERNIWFILRKKTYVELIRNSRDPILLTADRIWQCVTY